MRKLLLATTALVGSVALSGAAHAMPAQTSPITLNVGGYVDFVAGFYHEAQGATLANNAGTGFGSESIGPVSGVGPSTGERLTSRDFETEYKINFDAMGKASNGMQYGANVSLWNGPEAQNLWTGGGSTVEMNSAYVWLSGAFGKAMFGDSHGATDLFVYAPTVGEGQLDGRYMDFTSPFLLARMMPSGIDNTEHSTNVTYYTPKVGNDNNKVQLGITYEPNMYDYGSNVTKAQLTNPNSVLSSNLVNGVSSPYQDVVKGAFQYSGNFHPVNLVASAQIITGSGGANNFNTVPMFAFAPALTGGASNSFPDFTAWGLGTQIGFGGFTVGGAYNDLGHYGAVTGQNRDQSNWNIGGKYEFDKVAIGAGFLTGEGYDNLLAGATTAVTTANRGIGGVNYVKEFNAYSLGAAYTWFPGLSTNADGVFFSQAANQVDHNQGYVVLISQKMTF